MKTYLYLKTHQVTGLKYLGKTTQDPHKYKGSGLRWTRHLAKHGNDVSTLILFESNNLREIKTKGQYYSELWNVVNDQNFANMRPETGDGGNTSQCENYKVGMSKRDTSGSKNSMFGRSAVIENNLRWYNNGTENIYVPAGTQSNLFVPGRIIKYKKPHTEETKIKLSQYGKKPCISPSGEIFNSRGDAAKAYGITSAAIGGLIKRGVSGWHWL
jgi:hypothetical protein